MTINDHKYVQKVFETLKVSGTWLELGVGYGGRNCKGLCDNYNLSYVGTDMVSASNVDVIIDFETPKDLFNTAYKNLSNFDGVLVLNVLEHTFDPTLVLDNVISILKPGGLCIIVTPVIWPIHNYPIDCWRPLPDYYRKYSHLRNLVLNDNLFEYISFGRILDFKQNNIDVFPPASTSKIMSYYSRFIHRFFNTTGRGKVYSDYVAIGVVLQKNN